MSVWFVIFLIFAPERIEHGARGIAELLEKFGIHRAMRG